MEFRHIRGGYVYLLIDPRNNHIRYVGTTDDVPRRMATHRSDKKKLVGKWIAELSAVGLEPNVKVVAKIEDPAGIGSWDGDVFKCLQAAERSLIAFYHTNGAGDLLNIAYKPKTPKWSRASVCARQPIAV